MKKKREKIKNVGREKKVREHGRQNKTENKKKR